MPLLSWLPLFKSKVEVEAKNKSRGNEILPQPTPASVDGTDFDNIADQVEALQSHLASAIDAHDEAILRAGLLKLEIADLEKVLESERKANGSLKRQLEAERKKTPPNVAAQIANDKALIKKHRAIISQQEARLAAQAATLTAQANLLSARTNHARELEERLIDIQFDLEYLQCTTKIERSFQSTTVREQDCPLVAQPFVVVLVDGDGYRVSAGADLQGFDLLTLSDDSGRRNFSTTLYPACLARVKLTQSSLVVSLQQGSEQRLSNTSWINTVRSRSSRRLLPGSSATLGPSVLTTTSDVSQSMGGFCQENSRFSSPSMRLCLITSMQGEGRRGRTISSEVFLKHSMSANDVPN